MKSLIRTLATLTAILSAGLTGFLFVKNRLPSGMLLWVPKLLAGALAPFVAVVSAASALIGLLTGAPLTVIVGALGALGSGQYVRRIFGTTADFDHAFEPGWENRIPTSIRAHMLTRRWTWKLEPDPEVSHTRDVPYWTIPGGDRQLLCDIWQPPEYVKRSGLALMYAHGSAWIYSDKDVSTRPFFRHLAGQGHVVMDIAYRLFPEADMLGMLGDVKRAIAWMRENAAQYGVNPERIVVGGGSAGAHLSLLAAYTVGDPELTPDELKGADLSVCGVISEYGPTDLLACYYLTGQHESTGHVNPGERFVPRKTRLSQVMRSLAGERYEVWGLDKGWGAAAFIYLLGGHPDQIPETYARFSPVTHVHPGCPPTLLIQGEDDMLTSVEATRELADRLAAAGVPVINLILPQTEHAFDLLLPSISPPAQAALYAVERFLALLAAPAE